MKPMVPLVPVGCTPTLPSLRPHEVGVHINGHDLWVSRCVGKWVGSRSPWLCTSTSFLCATTISAVHVCTCLPSFAPTLNVFGVLAVHHSHPPLSVVVYACPHLCLHLHASTCSCPTPTCIWDNGSVGGSCSSFVSVTPLWFLVLVHAYLVLCLFALIPATWSCLFDLHTCLCPFVPAHLYSFACLC